MEKQKNVDLKKVSRQQFEAKKNEILKEINEIDEELAKERAIASLYKESISSGKKVEKKTKIKEMPRERKNRDYEPFLTLYLRKVMCPLCQERRRQILFRTCGHAICSKCLVDRHVCPICQGRHSEADIKNINLKEPIPNN